VGNLQRNGIFSYLRGDIWIAIAIATDPGAEGQWTRFNMKIDIKAI